MSHLRNYDCAARLAVHESGVLRVNFNVICAKAVAEKCASISMVGSWSGRVSASSQVYLYGLGLFAQLFQG